MKANVAIDLAGGDIPISGEVSFSVRMTERERKFIPRLVESLKDKDLPWGTKCATPEYAVRWMIHQLMDQYEASLPKEKSATEQKPKAQGE